MKSVVRIDNTYLKGIQGAPEYLGYVDDTRDYRIELMENYFGLDLNGDEEGLSDEAFAFISHDSDTYELGEPGDWDDPVATRVTMLTPEEARTELKIEYMSRLADLEEILD